MLSGNKHRHPISPIIVGMTATALTPHPPAHLPLVQGVNAAAEAVWQAAGLLVSAEASELVPSSQTLNLVWQVRRGGGRCMKGEGAACTPDGGLDRLS